MCRRQSERSRRKKTHPAAVFNYQTSISRCVVEFGYGLAGVATDRNSAELLCLDCKSRYNRSCDRSQLFAVILRHFIYVDTARRADERRCRFCGTDLAIWREITDCNSCSEAFVAFLDHLREENISFNSLPNPIVIDVDAEVGPHNIIFSRRLSTFLHGVHVHSS